MLLNSLQTPRIPVISMRWLTVFGHPMSHGCVNLPTTEAEWLFNWMDVGTLVNIHS